MTTLSICAWLPIAWFGGTEGPASGDSGKGSGSASGSSSPGSPPAEAPRESMDEEAFKAEIVNHIDSMYRLGLSLTRNPQKAEDLAQEGLTKALTNYRQFRPNTNMRAWLLAIVRNAFINRYRREKKAPNSVDFDDVEAFVADTSTNDEGRGLSVRSLAELAKLEEQLDDELVNALNELSDEFRETFLLAVVEELSYKDIAVILGVPVGTVMSRLFRARRQMASRLQTYAETSGWLSGTGEGAGENGGNDPDGADGNPDAAD